jgi:hypothetical protein
MGPWEDLSGQPITDVSGAIVECADHPCESCGVPDGCHYALLICNANAQVDDEFDIRLNGTLIGHFSGDDPGCGGNLFVTNSEIPISDVPMSECCAAGVTKSTISASLFSSTSTNTVRMTNVGTNNNNNWGVIAVWRLLYEGGVVIYKNLCYSDIYSGPDGQNFVYDFVNCDCEIPPCCDTPGGGPTAIIDVEQTGPCQWTLTSASTPGSCGSLASCQWTYRINQDNDSDPEDATIVSGCTLELAPSLECAPKQILVHLKVTDTEGCESIASVTLDCSECSPVGDLTATLISINEDGTCTYELCASISGGSPEECGGIGAFINVIVGDGCNADSCGSCEDIGTGSCCGVNLFDGDCMEVVVEGSLTAIWSLWSRICGCRGPANTLFLACVTCPCCLEPSSGIYVTLSGFADGDNGCLCSALNGTYFLPFVSECFAEISIEDVFPCDGPPEEDNEQNVTMQVIIVCDVDKILIFGLLSVPPIGEIDYYKEVSGTLPMDCSTALDGNIPFATDEPDPNPNFCAWGAMSIDVV